MVFSQIETAAVHLPLLWRTTEEMLPMLEENYLAIAHLCSNDG